MRRMSMVLALATLFIPGNANAQQRAAESEAALIARARAIHERVITMDTHDDIPNNFGSDEANPCRDMPNRQVDIPKMRQGGLDVAWFIVYVGQGARTPEGNERAEQTAMQKFNGIHRMAEVLCPDQIAIAYTADDVERIVRSGKLATAIGIENGYVIGNDLSLIKTYYDLGGRYMTLAHTSHNDIADSSNPQQEEHGGLSKFGEQVVAELNRVGMFVDVSHISKKASIQAARLSKAPVIGSHSSTTRWAAVPRNMDEEQLRAVAATGGVVNMVALAGYVTVQPPERNQELTALRQEFGITGGRGGGGRRGARGGAAGQRGAADTARVFTVDSLPPARRAEYDRRLAAIEAKYPLPAVKDFVNHIDHAVSVIGIDHVGISSDFDGGGGISGWDNAAESLNITIELVRRGYTEEQIAKLWGGNMLRAWREMARAAAQLQR
jgi:membrane dipeptidase